MTGDREKFPYSFPKAQHVFYFDFLLFRIFADRFREKVFFSLKSPPPCEGEENGKIQLVDFVLNSNFL